MTIEPTDEMIDAFWVAHDAPEDGDGGTKRGLAAVLTLIERDYISRWGTLVMPIGPAYTEQEMLSPDFLEYAKDEAERRAKYMGATIERDSYEIVRQPSPNIANTVHLWVYLEWKLRRND